MHHQRRAFQANRELPAQIRQIGMVAVMAGEPGQAAFADSDWRIDFTASFFYEKME